MEVDPAAVLPGPVPDPGTGDDTDEDQAADGVALPPGDSADVPHVGALATDDPPRSDAGPPDTAPADPVEVGSG